MNVVSLLTIIMMKVVSFFNSNYDECGFMVTKLYECSKILNINECNKFMVTKSL